MNRNALLILCACALGCAGFSKEALGYTYAEIVVPGLTGATAAAINDRGDIVGYGTGSTGTVAFLERGGAFTLIVFPGSIATQANGINNAGDIVGTYTDAAGSHGFKYSAGVWTAIDAPAPALPNTTRVAAINNLGQIAGSYSPQFPGNGANPSSDSDAFVETGGTFIFIPGDRVHVLTPAGLNDSGEVVGLAVPMPGFGHEPPSPAYGNASGFVLASGGFPGQAAFNGLVGFAAINNSGQAILSGPYFQHLYVSYLQSSVTQTTAGQIIVFPGSGTTAALGINNNGTIVGSFVDAGGATHAFLGAPANEPACSATVGSGPPAGMTFSLQDSSGVAQIVVTRAVNATPNIPGFDSGTTSAVVVTAGVTIPAQTASVILTVTNSAGFSSSCGLSMNGTGAPWSSPGGVLTSNTVTNLTSDGSLEAYALGSDASLWHISQTGPGGPWGTWSSLGGNGLVSEPALVTDSNGQLEIFVISADGYLWNLAQTAPGNWSGAVWHSIASGVKGRPSVARYTGNGRLQVFARAADDSVIYLAQPDAGSSPWSAVSLGGVITSNPAASPFGSSVVALGTDQALWRINFDFSGNLYSPWTSVGGSLKGDPVPVYLGWVVRGSDDAVWAQSEYGWQSLGGRILDNPRVIRNSDGRLELFVEGTDHAVWHSVEVGINSAPQAPAAFSEWSAWSTLGGIITGDVVPALDASGAVNIFVQGADRGLWYLTQPSPGSWQ
jgi:probable HAF family extracellular repeat protein